MKYIWIKEDQSENQGRLLPLNGILSKFHDILWRITKKNKSWNKAPALLPNELILNVNRKYCTMKKSKMWLNKDILTCESKDQLTESQPLWNEKL